MARATRLPGLLTLVLFGALLRWLAPAPAHGADKVVVTLWTWNPGPSVVAEMVAAIEHVHPDIELRAIVQPAEVYFNALAEASAAGTLPDIVGLPAGAETQRLRDRLQELSTKASDILGKDWKKHFSSELLGEARLGNPKGDDSLYIMPMTTEVLGLWFDAPALIKARLLSPPRSLDEMEADADKLRQAGVSPLALGAASGRAMIGLFLQIAAQTDAADLLSAESGQPVWSRPGMVQAASVWRSLFTRRIADQAALTTPEGEAAAAFAQGHAGMSPQSSDWLRQAHPSEKPKPFEYGPFAFPAINPRGQSSPPLGGVSVGWAMTRNATGSSDVDRASQIIWHDLIVGPGAQVAVNDLAGLPAHDGLRPQLPLPGDVQRLYDVFRAQLGGAKPHVIGDPAVQEALMSALRAVAAGNETPEKAMQAVDTAVRQQRLLAR
jgi:raffinose/stachyose/melibiose transport system substrate-binding protein